MPVDIEGSYYDLKKLILFDFHSAQIAYSNNKISDESNECLESYHLFIISILTGVLIEQAWLNAKGEKKNDHVYFSLFRLIKEDCAQIVTKYVVRKKIVTKGLAIPGLSSIKNEPNFLTEIISLYLEYKTDFKESILSNKPYILIEYDEESDTSSVSKEYGRKNFHVFLLHLFAIEVQEITEGDIIITGCDDYKIDWKPAEGFFDNLMVLYNLIYLKYKNS